MFIKASRGSSGSLCWAAVVAAGIAMMSLLSQTFLLAPPPFLALRGFGGQSNHSCIACCCLSCGILGCHQRPESYDMEHGEQGFEV